MDTFLGLRNFLARLAGAPGLVRSRRGDASRHRSGLASAHASGLYARDGTDRPRTPRQRDGQEAEELARRYLECAGLTFLAANVRYRDGEIDLVMRDVTRATGFVFVEVRRRSRDHHGGAVASVTGGKRRRLVAAASHYLVGLGLRTLPACRFDVVAVSGDACNGFRVDWIRDAFQDDGREGA